MTIVITLKSELPESVRGNAKSRRKARRATEFAGKQAVSRTLKAVSLPSVKEPETTGSICIPDVAKYQAGHRKVREDATHIVS